MEKTKLAQTSDESTKRLKTRDNMDTRDHPPLITTTQADPTPTRTMSDAESPPAIKTPHSLKKQTKAHHRTITQVHPTID